MLVSWWPDILVTRYIMEEIICKYICQQVVCFTSSAEKEYYFVKVRIHNALQNAYRDSVES